jgi:hypothetical protein
VAGPPEAHGGCTSTPRPEEAAMGPRTTDPSRSRRRWAGLVLLALVAVWACAAVGWSAGPAAAAGTGSIQGFTLDDQGRAVGGVHVSINAAGTFAGFAISNSSGIYTIDNVPFGSYNIAAKARCKGFSGTGVTVDGTERLDFAIPTQSLSDSFGYACRSTPQTFEHVLGGKLALTGDDASTTVPLPFAFPYYGHTYSAATISTNGALNFQGASTPFTNVAVPSSAAPNAAIYPFWDDLEVDASADVSTQTGFPSDPYFLIEWFNVLIRGTSDRVTFTVRLRPDGRIEFNYTGIGNSPLEHGLSATIGIEDEGGNVGLVDSVNSLNVQSDVLVEYDVNSAPTANAGKDFSVASGADFTLNGSQTSDPDGQPLTFLWEQVGGPTVTVLDRDKQSARVTGTPKGPATLSFQLTATDPFGQQRTDLVQVTVKAPK